MKDNKDRINEINELSSSAYSRCYYTDQVWNGIIKKYIKEGWNNESISEVLRSKYMRWLMDSNNGKKVNLKKAWEFLQYNEENIKDMLKKELDLSVK